MSYFQTNHIALPGDELDLADEWKLSASGLVVPSRAVELPIAIDLFAGAGGFSCGFHQAGFHVAAALEYDFDAAITYMVNLANPGVQIHFDTPEREEAFAKHLEKYFTKINASRYGHPLKAQKKKNDNHKREQVPYVPLTAGSGWISHYGEEPWEYPNEYLQEINRPPIHPFGCEHFWIADVRNLTGKQMLKSMGLKQGDVTCVMGGPPCQGFSTAGKQDVMDPRNSLVFEFARMILEIQPKTFVMENVPGIIRMRTPDGLLVIDVFCSMLEKGGYGSAKLLKDGLLATAGLQPGGAARGRKVENHDPDDEFKPNRRKSDVKPKKTNSKAKQLSLIE